MDWLDWLLLVARVVIVFFALLIAVLLTSWFERFKQLLRREA